MILPSCHGTWTLGGVVGAVLTLAATDVPWSAIALVAALPVLAAAAPYLARDHGVAATVTETDVPWRRASARPVSGGGLVLARAAPDRSGS